MGLAPLRGARPILTPRPPAVPASPLHTLVLQIELGVPASTASSPSCTILARRVDRCCEDFGDQGAAQNGCVKEQEGANYDSHAPNVNYKMTQHQQERRSQKAPLRFPPAPSAGSARVRRETAAHQQRQPPCCVLVNTVPSMAPHNLCTTAW